MSDTIHYVNLTLRKRPTINLSGLRPRCPGRPAGRGPGPTSQIEKVKGMLLSCHIRMAGPSGDCRSDLDMPFSNVYNYAWTVGRSFAAWRRMAGIGLVKEGLMCNSSTRRSPVG